MESICNFTPLWREDELIAKPDEAIEEIRTNSLKLFLDKNKTTTNPSPSLEFILSECYSEIEELLSGHLSSNVVLQRIREVGAQCQVNPVLVIKTAISLWYTSSVPIFTRDPQQGLPPDSEIEVDEDGTPILRWSRRYSAEQHLVGNLGLMAMLMTSEVWQPPKHPMLQTAALVSNAATTVLFATYMISSRIHDFGSWDNALSACQNDEGMKLFLKTAWQIARDGINKAESPPAAEFGATLDEVKVSGDGKKLLSKVGRSGWYETPYWHPCRKVPGSPWNKYMRNFCQPIFPTTTTTTSSSNAAGIVCKLPSSALTLSEPWETYYSEVRSKFDQTGRSRTILTEDSREEQFETFAAMTGSQYPSFRPAETTANYSEEVEQEFLYNVPMIKKPITDLRGDLTMPFLTTASRAMRFEEEPDEVEAGFFVMTFAQ